jgi:hypothetical protein
VVKHLGKSGFPHKQGTRFFWVSDSKAEAILPEETMNPQRSLNSGLLGSVLLAVLVTVVLGAQTVLAGSTVTVYKSPT